MNMIAIIGTSWIVGMTGYTILKVTSTKNTGVKYRSLRYLALQDKKMSKKLNEEVR